MNEELAALRDIHLPDPVPWWPPAPGWWGLLALLVATVILTLWLRARRRRDRWRAAALTELRALRLRWQSDELEPAALVQALSILLRRVALARFPRPRVAALHGEAWLAFLDGPLKAPDFSDGPGRVLAAGPYARSVEADPAPLLALAERWLRALPREAAG